MAERAHASLGASGAHRWMNCPGSPRLIDKVGVQRSSIYADEGTAAHALAEQCLSQGQDAAEYAGRVIDINGMDMLSIFLAKGAVMEDGRFEVDEEMVDGVQLFLDTVREYYDPEAGDILHTERRVHLSDDMFGTADAVVVKPDGWVFVFDFKYGAGVLVDVENNPQLIYYAEGAFRAVENSLDRLAGVEIVIVQPRCPHSDGAVRSATIDPLQLLDWSLKIEAAAEATRDPNAPLVPWTPEHGGEDWCRWCPAAGACPARASRALAVAQEDFDDLDNLDTIDLPAPTLLSPRQIAKVLDGASILTTWLESVRQYAYAEADAGRPIPGYKLVDKVPRRRWLDEGEVARIIAAHTGTPIKQVYTDPKLKSPAQVEKLIGKKDFEHWLSELAPPVSSGTTLAAESDRRPAVVGRIESEFDVIGDEDD